MNNDSSYLYGHKYGVSNLLIEQNKIHPFFDGFNINDEYLNAPN